MIGSTRTFMAIAAAAWISAGAGACLDFTPITTFGASGADASIDGEAGVVSQMDKCLSCAAGGSDGGGCMQEYTACVGFPTCKAAMLCVTGMCLTSIATISACLTACEDDAGVSDPSSAGNPPFSALLSCMSTHCETSCIP
jgi:hypothetical protein